MNNSKTSLCILLTAMTCLTACRDDVREGENEVRAGIPCALNAECPDGMLCKNLICVTSVCATDADCDDGQVCDQGKCILKPDKPECTTDADCAGGQVCSGGFCMPGPTEACKNNSDCPKNHGCRDRQCGDVACSEDTDCPEKSVCKDNQCQTVECTLDAHCADLHVCQNNACKKVECLTDSDCSGDLLCATDSHECCDSDRMCNDVCCEYAGACFGGICSPCERDETVCVTEGMDPAYLCCASNELCMDNQCVKFDTSCYDNYACPDGLYCDLDSHTCIPKIVSTENCEDEALPTGGTFEPHLLFHWGEGKLAPGGNFPDHINVIDAPMVADVNGDGMPEIVFNSWLKDSMSWEDNGILRIISGKDGTLLASSDGNPKTDPSSQVAIGRLYPRDMTTYNGVDVSGLQIITCTEDHHLVAYNHEAKLIWKSDSETEECGNTAFGLVDFDGDGVPEIHARYRIYNAQTGKFIAGAENDDVSGANYAIAADLDEDGMPELIGGNVAYRVDLKKGKLAAVYQRLDQPDGYPAIADLDLDGKPEIVVTRKTYHDTSWGDLSHTVMAFKHDGTDFWSAPVDVHQGTLDEWGGGPATIARIDDDTHPSVMLSSGTHYMALSYQGKLKWSHGVQDMSSRSTGSAVFDFNGDGKAEVLYGDELFLRVYDGVKGETTFCLCNTSATLYEYPVVADVNNDGHAEIVLASNRTKSNKNCPGSAQYIKGEVDACIQSLLDGPSSGRKGSSGVRVYSGEQVVEDKVQASKWMPTRRIYNQHAYSVTNILDDGTIPAKARVNWKTDGLNNFRMNVLKNAKDYKMHFKLYSDSWLHSHTCREKERSYFSILNDGLVPIPVGTTIQADVYSEKTDKPLQTYYVKTEEVIWPGKSVNMYLEIETPKTESSVDLEIRYRATGSDICRMDSSDDVYLRAYLHCSWK